MKTSRKIKIDELVKFDREFKCKVIGTDEAGRGPLAGPVVAAAVYFPELNSTTCELIKYLDDSKSFSSNIQLRKELSENIKNIATYSIQLCDVEEIDKINILKASLQAMKKSCDDVFRQLNLLNEKKINSENIIVLVDGRHIIPNYKPSQKAVKKGDTLSASIAAASILAKVHRDEIMENLAEKYPQYGWKKNKGYPTAAHIEALKTYGKCAVHRKSFLTKIFCEQKKIF